MAPAGLTSSSQVTNRHILQLSYVVFHAQGIGVGVDREAHRGEEKARVIYGLENRMTEIGQVVNTWTQISCSPG